MTKFRQLKALIIEDNANDEQQLRNALNAYPHIEITGIYKTGNEGLTAILSQSPDLVFLDIELPDMKGLDIMESLDNKALSNCHFVAYTAYVDYMLESFRNHAFDFLLKPIKQEDLDSIIRRLQVEGIPQQPQTDGKIYKAEENLLLFVNSNDFRMVRLCDIGVFQYNSEHRVWEAVIANIKKPVRLKRNVTNKMLVTLGKQFVQVNQKYVININYLLQVTDNLCSFYPPFQDVDYVKVGSSFRRQLTDMFLCL